MEFVTAGALHSAVQRVLSGKIARCAVAFWGAGAESLFTPSAKKVQIICNLSMGGTNPEVIKKLMKIYEVKQCDHLHAKVYIGDTEAVVGSANASTGGLGFQAKKPWIEGAMRTHDIKTIGEWFEALWNDAETTRDISESDLEDAKHRFARIQSAAQPTYVVVASEEPSEAAVKAAKRAEEEEGIANLDLYENWPEIPNGAILIDYHIGKRGSSINGKYETFLPAFERSLPKGGVVKLCKKKRLSSSQRSLYGSAAWKEAANRLYKERGSSVVPIDVFKSGFLNR